MSRHPAKRNGGVFPLLLWRSPPSKTKSAKIVPATAARSWLFPKISANPLFTLAEKRHFYPPKLPALRAEVDGQTQKSVRPFSCFLAAFSPRRPKSLDFDHFQQFPAFAASGFSRGHLVLFRCFLPTLPYSGATSGLRASGGYTLDCVRKAAQIADTGATARNTLSVTAASPSRAVHTSFPCPPAGQEKRASVHLLKSPLPEMPALLRLPRPASRRPSSRP